MRNILTIASLLISFSCYSQKQQAYCLKVVDLKEYNYCYLITGVNSLTADSLCFLSIKYSIYNNSGFEKIKVGKVYLFYIGDMDNIDGHFPAALPNGYFLKVGNKHIKREGRNGNTVTTTQFISKNSKGLWIKKVKRDSDINGN